jgi:hypothetical protein
VENARGAKAMERVMRGAVRVRKDILCSCLKVKRIEQLSGLGRFGFCNLYGKRGIGE